MTRTRSTRAAAVGLSLIGMVVGCTGPGDGQDLPPNAELVQSAPVAIDVAAAGTSGIETPARRVITDAAAWAAAWTEIHATVQPEPARPEVDFGKSVVFLAAMGTRSSGGYSIAIEGVYRAADRLYVLVREKSPGPSCMTTQAITAPVAAVSTARVELPVTFLERKETVNC